MAPEDVVNSVDPGRREFVRQVIGASAFAVPLLASFAMDGLSIDAAEAQSLIANQQPPSIQVVPVHPRRVGSLTTYQAKFVCGTSDGGTATLGRGIYFTSINVRNLTDETLSVAQKVVQTNDAQIISDPTTQVLGPDAGLQVDCNDIRSAIGVGGSSVIEGFVVFTVGGKHDKLDVVAVYTAQGRF